MGRELKEKRRELQSLISSRQKAVISNNESKSILKSYMTSTEARGLCKTGQATMREVADYIRSREKLEQSIEVMTDAVKTFDAQIERLRREVNELEQKRRNQRNQALKLLAPVLIIGFEKLCRWMESWGWSISHVVYDVALALLLFALFADFFFLLKWLQRKRKH